MRLNDFIVPDHELLVSVSTEFDSQELRGESSSTSVAHKGVKAKVIDVSLLIRFNESDHLKAMYQTAEAIDGIGDLLVYNIVDPTANALSIRQVRFYGRIVTREMRKEKAWRVTFQLREHLSVPEKQEQRLTSNSESSLDESLPPPSEDIEEPQLTGFEKILQSIDQSLS